MAGAASTLPFGKLGRPHGVRGELPLRPFSDDPAPLQRAELPLSVELVREGARRPAQIVAVRPFAEAFLVRLAGVDSREEAAAITNCEVWIHRPQLPALAEGEYYVEDLVGCEVFDLDGRRRGTVRNAFFNGAHDVLTVGDEAGAELLIPAVAEFLHQVDVTARRLVIDPHE